jgi:hypothetical protein
MILRCRTLHAICRLDPRINKSVLHRVFGADGFTGSGTIAKHPNRPLIAERQQ